MTTVRTSNSVLVVPSKNSLRIWTILEVEDTSYPAVFFYPALTLYPSTGV